MQKTSAAGDEEPLQLGMDVAKTYKVSGHALQSVEFLPGQAFTLHIAVSCSGPKDEQSVPPN